MFYVVIFDFALTAVVLATIVICLALDVFMGKEGVVSELSHCPDKVRTRAKSNEERITPGSARPDVCPSPGTFMHVRMRSAHWRSEN